MIKRYKTYGVRNVGASRRALFLSKPSAVSLITRKAAGTPVSRSGVKGPIGNKQELNFTDVAISGAITTGLLTLLNGIAEGDDNTDRSGKKVVMKSVQVHGMLAYGAAGSREGRALLIWDNAPNGVLPAITDILTVSTSNGFPNINNVGRFSILKDVHPDPALGVAQGTTTQMPIEFYKKLNDATRFLGTGATIASIQNGALYLLLLGADSSNATVDIRTRVRFIEK